MSNINIFNNNDDQNQTSFDYIPNNMYLPTCKWTKYRSSARHTSGNSKENQLGSFCGRTIKE
jgi:hypothetical protein